MQAWKILTHAIRQVFGNLGPAVRISGVLYLLLWGILLFVDLRYGQDLGAVPDLGAEGAATEMNAASALFGPALLSLTAVLVIDLWIAVSWHRFVLTSEYPAGLLPRFEGRRILGYFGATMAVVAVASVLLAALTLVGVPVSASLGGGLLLQVLVTAVMVVGVALLLRMATVLPGYALEPGHRLMEGWTATRGRTSDFVLLVLVAGAATSAVQFVTIGLFGQLPILLVAVTFLVQWVVTMVSISILTTLYGHYIEGRALV